MRFRIDLKIFLLIILFFLTKQIELYAMMMFFAIIHELGHLFTGITLGMRPEKLELNPFGLSVSFKILPKEYNMKLKKANSFELKKIFIAMAGPVTNLLVILIVTFMSIDTYPKQLIIYSNLLLVMFNILPIYPLDGGRVVKGLLHIFVGKYKSDKYINNISFITLSILTAISSIAILYINNIAIFLGIITLWVIYIREEKVYRKREKIYEMIRNRYNDNYLQKYNETIENK